MNIDDQMVAIPAGQIELRDDRLKTKWRVDLQPFLLSKYLITQDIYRQVTGVAPSTFLGDLHPVETVSWQDAVMFCNSLSTKLGLEQFYLLETDNQTISVRTNLEANGYRLPTEAEWEYACKAGSLAVRYGALDAIAWYKPNSGGTTHPIASKEPNPWGLYDMLGNVWEWCSDVYDETVYGSYRIIRGGGWCDEERGCMATNRRRSHPVAFKIDDLGFRIARNN